MPSSFSIRPIQQKDNPIVTTIIRTVMTSFGAVGDGFSINDPEVNMMYESYNHPRSRFYVVVNQDDTPVGCGGLAPLTGKEKDTCEVRKMYFLPECRGHGLGKQLMDIILKDAKRLEYKQCYLETLERLEAANHLYQKAGFKKLDNAIGCTGHGACDHFYVKTL